MPVDFDALVMAPCIAAFGNAEAVFSRPGGAATVTAIFDRHGASLRFDGESTVSVRQPRLGVRLADFPADFSPRQGDACTVTPLLPDGSRGSPVAWKVMDTQPDGMGGLSIMLSGRSTADDDRP